MRRLSIALSIVAALVLSLVIIGQGYSQGNETEGNDTGRREIDNCCALASAYDGVDNDRLDIIREFRDEYLATNPVGRGVAVLYYDVISPPLAGFISDHPSIKPLSRVALAPVAALSAIAVDTNAAEKAVLGGLLVLASAGIFIGIRRRRNRRARSA